MILTESTMKYILTFILSFLSFLVCSQNITITDIPTIDQLAGKCHSSRLQRQRRIYVVWHGERIMS